MADAQKDEDLRIPCKYGKKCYQTNQYHLNKYKHSDNGDAEDDDVDSHSMSIKRKPTDEIVSDAKRQRLDTESADAQAATNKAASASSKEDVDIKALIKDTFRVEMPDDFYEFWVFCKSLKKESPADALFSLLGLRLTGAYDLISGDLSSSLPRDHYLTYCRYFYDPPEFMTVITSDNPSDCHIGYYRDDPSELPAFVGSNMSKSKKDPCVLAIEGDNMFSAIRQFIQGELKQTKNKSKEKELKSLDSKLCEWCKRHSFSEDMKSSSRLKARRKQVVCKSFHGAGLVVPVHNDVGYRDLQHTDGELKKLFKRIDEAKSDSDRIAAFEPLQEIVTLVQFANDECDYGMGLELGIDMFCFGSKYLHKTILSVLPLVYELLNRDLYADIIRAHLKDRTA